VLFFFVWPCPSADHPGRLGPLFLQAVSRLAPRCKCRFLLTPWLERRRSGRHRTSRSNLTRTVVSSVFVGDANTP